MMLVAYWNKKYKSLCDDINLVALIKQSWDEESLFPAIKRH